MYKLNKALYRLKQTHRAWYERLTSFLINKGYVRESVDKTLFVINDAADILVVHIFVDDIIFGGTSEALVKVFTEDVTQEFEMSLVGELKYFLGLQIHQTQEGVFISQSTYAKALLKKFRLDQCKEARTPISTTTKISRDENGESVDPRIYRGMIGSSL